MSIAVKDATGTSQTIQTLPSPGQAGSTASLPVVIASDQTPIPVSGAATSANISALSSAITGALAPTGGLPIALQGTAAVTQSGTWTVALAANATVALAGGNTVALKVDGSAATQPVSGTVTANLGTLNGAATASLQTAGNTSLSAIASSLPATLGAKTSAGSLSVAPATDATFPISATALPLPSGAATSALQSTGNTSLASLVTALAGVLKVGGTTARAFASFTRPANTTAYASGQLVANSTTAASVTPIPLPVARVNGGTCAIPTVKLSKSSTGVTNASFRIHLYRNAPTASNGDGGVWLTTSSIYLGYADITMDKVFTDEASGTGVVKDTAGNPRTLLTDTASGSQNIYALIEARGAYTPASAEAFTLTAEVAQD